MQKKIFIYLPYFGFLIFFLITLIFFQHKTNLILFGVGSFLYATIILFIFRKIEIGNYYFFFACILLWVNIIGEIGSYYTLPFYDKIGHFITGFFVSSVVYFYFKRHLKENVIAIFLSSLGLFTLWEIYEYLVFVFYDYPTVGVYVGNKMIVDPLKDTIMDIFLSALGSFIYLISKKFKRFF